MLTGATGSAFRLRWFLPLAVALTATAASGAREAGAPGGSGLWTGPDLLAPPAIGAGDTVTVVLRASTKDAPAATAKGPSRPEFPRELAARVVKVLPNGNLVVEARASVGEGYVLLGGEVARVHVDARRRTTIAGLARLAVVTRGIDGGALGIAPRATPAVSAK